MNTLGTYRGYTGSAHRDQDTGVFWGKIKGIDALITYEALTVQTLCKEFRMAVDDYLAWCEQEGFEAEVPK